MTAPDRFWCRPGADRCYDDPVEAFEAEIDCLIDMENGPMPGESYELEEREVRPSIDFVPSAVTLLEQIHEDFCGIYSADECPLEGIEEDTELLALLDQFRERFASKVTWQWAGKVVKVHTITFDPHDTHEPLLDGEPLYERKTNA